MSDEIQMNQAATKRSRVTRSLAVCALLLVTSFVIRYSSFAGEFAEGTAAYRNGDYATAARAFAAAAARKPASGAFQNYGLAEWQRGRKGFAVLAWERALWVDPANAAARENLAFARKVDQLEAPRLLWHEVASTWLPVNAWAWLAGVSFWFAVAAVILPAVFRWKRRGWQQASAALGLAVFLMCIPAMLGVGSRAQIGFVLESNTPIRLTPTRDAQTVTMLNAGEPARIDRTRGNYYLIRTTFGHGWVERRQFGRVCPE